MLKLLVVSFVTVFASLSLNLLHLPEFTYDASHLLIRSLQNE